jgi:hypothetical protein
MPGRAARRGQRPAAATGRMGSIVMPRARRTWAARQGAARQGGGGARNYQPNRYSEHTETSIAGDVISLASHAFRMRLTTGRAKRQALSTPSTGEPIGASLPVFILTVPNNPIRHPCARSDYNCGATLIHAGMCVHVFSIEFACLRGRWSAPLCKISF